MRTPTLVLDVNETLSDLAPLAGTFTGLGAPAATLRAWFPAVLRDGFALAVHGEAAPFADVARATLRTVLTGVDSLTVPVEEAADAVLAAFVALPAHPDVPDGLRGLHEAGFGLATLSNGATSVAHDLLVGAGVRDLVEPLLSVEDVGVWKPHPRAYAHAVEQTGRAAHDLVLVAAHPWDTDGAARAGLRTAYLDRSGAPWPACFRPPELTAPDLVALAGVLAAAG